MNLTIIRGYPGSGKTTLAHALSKETGAIIIESDMLRTRDGKYVYASCETKLINQATRWLLTTVAKQGADVIMTGCFATKAVIDNLIATSKRVCPDRVNVTIVRCTDEFNSVHHVPDEVCQDMAERWEDIDDESLYSSFDDE